MSDNSKIEWTDSTWNPLKSRRKDDGKIGWHCERVSAGCTNCYAEAMNRRKLNVGTGLDYVRSSRDQVDIIIDEKTLVAPLKWRKPRKVFVCSMTDLFAEFVPFDFIDRVFAVMALCRQHTFQVLSKRPERMAEYFASRSKSSLYWESSCPVGYALRWEYAGASHPLVQFPLPNVWIGTSVENQEWADKRIPHLLKCPAAVRFLSCEPLLGPIDLSAYFGGGTVTSYNFGIDWVIVGGESGRNARPMHTDWVRGIRNQCQAAGVPLHFKQWGEWIPYEQSGQEPFRESQDGDMFDAHGWPEKLTEHEPVDGWYSTDLSGVVYRRVGKKAAGRLLDGREWSEFPQSVTTTEETK